MEGNGKGAVAADADELARRFDVDVVPTAPEESDLRRSRRARTVRRAFMSLVAAVVLLGLAGWLGVRSSTVTAAGGGYELTVTYAQIARPGLAAPWSLEVRRPGGFDGPITISTTSSYLDMFDENGFDPEPSTMTATAEQVIWEFEAPPGDVLSVSLDARIEPGVHSAKLGETSILEDGEPVATARFKTWIAP